jgi:hypothetical protein
MVRASHNSNLTVGVTTYRNVPVSERRRMSIAWWKRTVSRGSFTRNRIRISQSDWVCLKLFVSMDDYRLFEGHFIPDSCQNLGHSSPCYTHVPCIFCVLCSILHFCVEKFVLYKRFTSITPAVARTYLCTIGDVRWCGLLYNVITVMLINALKKATFFLVV